MPHFIAGWYKNFPKMERRLLREIQHEQVTIYDRAAIEAAFPGGVYDTSELGKWRNDEKTILLSMGLRPMEYGG